VSRLERAVEHTAKNRRLTLVVALNYGSRAEIAAAARTLAIKAAAGEIDAAQVDETMLASELQTEGLPELDLLIRTSGELRLSNFLLWQAAYAELMFLDLLWPEFDEQAFVDAIQGFAARERRFGGR
jgi:undecaprenyl diphosphate synthase